jgi:eukaryotic-like serine/threonine-protein kinase
MPVPNKSQVPVGTVLEGKFRIEREIGRGGMAAVYDAEHIDIGKRVAVKILAAELITSRVVRERFIREARAAAAINSPYICNVYDSGMFEDRPFLVMELLEGESLYDMLTRLRQIDVETTVRICTQTARGLAKAHESNVVHRDLKPENIFVTKNEDSQLVAKIVDFGLAKFYEPTTPDAQTARLTREGALFGTPAYMSPEQAKGQGEVDHRADLWALGCIVYECLTGQTVWNVEQGVAMILAQIAGAPLPRPSKLRPDLPPSFDQWFARALDREPGNRFQTAREFADTMAEALLVGGPSTRKPQLNSEVESNVVDELIASELAAARLQPQRSFGPHTPPTALAAQVQPMHGAPTSALSTSPPPRQGSTLRAIAVLFVVAAVALGGYAAWLYVLHPPGGAKGATKSGDGDKGAAKGAYVNELSKGQEAFEKDPEIALETFEAAFQNSSAPAARSLLSHAKVAVEEAKGPCKVTAVARPRPYELDQAASRPSLLETPDGVVLAWVDNHLDPRRRQAFTVLLDRALRRLNEPTQVTPEAASVRQPELRRAGDKVALVYWDEGGKESAVYARLLEANGKIASPAKRLSSIKNSEFYPAVASAPGAGFWAVWAEQIAPGTTDIVARELSDNTDPKAEPVRLTAFLPAKTTATRATMPDATIAQGKLHVALSLELDPRRRQIMLLSIPLGELGSGLDMAPPKRGARPAHPPLESMGVLVPVSAPHSRNVQPRVACTEEGCYVAWNDEKAGASVAFVERDKTQKLWSREFSPKGQSPGLAAAHGIVQLAWFEESRVRMASVTRDGVGKPSVVNRVNGFQPTPALVPGTKSGEWLLSWRDYEAAHLEVFALRAVCR